MGVEHAYYDSKRHCHFEMGKWFWTDGNLDPVDALFLPKRKLIAAILASIVEESGDPYVESDREYAAWLCDELLAFRKGAKRSHMKWVNDCDESDEVTIVCRRCKRWPKDEDFDTDAYENDFACMCKEGPDLSKQMGSRYRVEEISPDDAKDFGGDFKPYDDINPLEVGAVATLLRSKLRDFIAPRPTVVEKYALYFGEAKPFIGVKTIRVTTDRVVRPQRLLVAPDAIGHAAHHFTIRALRVGNVNQLCAACATPAVIFNDPMTQLDVYTVPKGSAIELEIENVGALEWRWKWIERVATSQPRWRIGRWLRALILRRAPRRHVLKPLPFHATMICLAVQEH